MLLRKPNRIPEWDYRSMGAYFITICSHRKEHIFANITRVDPQSKTQYPYHRQTAYENELFQLRLSLIGQVIEKAIAGIEERYQGITVDHYVIMPNHVHLLLQIHELDGKTPSISTVIQQMKRFVSRHFPRDVWQKGFYDHVIRDEKDYWVKYRYIDNNPLVWLLREDGYC